MTKPAILIGQTGPSTPAESSMTSDDKKSALRILRKENPGFLPENYWDPMIKCIAEEITQKKAAELAGVKHASFYRQLKKARNYLERFHVEGVPTAPKTERVEYLTPGVLDVSVFQPRTETRPSVALIEDIRRQGGNTQAVIIREKPNRVGKLAFDVGGGHKRVAAITMINKELPVEEHLLVKCVVYEADDKEFAMIALVDNLLHEPLDTQDRNRAIADLHLQYGYSPSELAERFEDLNADSISNIIRAYRDTSSGIQKLLNADTIQVGHAKSIATLPKELQEEYAERIIKRIENTQLPPSTSEVEGWAKKDRERLGAKEKIVKYLKGIKKKKIKIAILSDILTATFDGKYHYKDYKVMDYDVRQAAVTAGVELVLPTAEKNMQALNDRFGESKPEKPKSTLVVEPVSVVITDSIPEDAAPGSGEKGPDKKVLTENESWILNCAFGDVNWNSALERLTLDEVDYLLGVEKRKSAIKRLEARKRKLEKEEKEIEELVDIEKSLCTEHDCASFSHTASDCALGLLDGRNPDDVLECPGYLKGDSPDPYMKSCLICKGQTVFTHGEAGYINLDPGSINLKHDNPFEDHRNHRQCIIDHLIKKKMLSGECATCNAVMCPILSLEISQLQPLIGQIRMSISECNYYSKRTKLKDINKWAQGEYAAAQKKAAKEAEK